MAMEWKQVFLYDGTQILLKPDMFGNYEYPKENGRILNHRKEFIHRFVLTEKSGLVALKKSGKQDNLK